MMTGNGNGKLFCIVILIFTVFGGFHLHAQNQETDPLVAAYQKEFVFLDNEIRLLKQRIAEVESEGSARVEEARSKLQALEERFLTLSAQVDKRSDELRMLEREQGSTEDATDTLASVINQGNQRLKKYNIESFIESVAQEKLEALSDDEKSYQELSYVFEKSLALLEKVGTVRAEADEFYLRDGTEVPGDIIHIGSVASFGISYDHGGTLAPAGGGKLKLVKDDTREVARRLKINPQEPRTLPIFLYESLDKASETITQKTLRDTIEGGGIIGIVILVLGGIAALLILLRVGFLLNSSRTNPKQLEQVSEYIERGETVTALEESRKLPGAMGRVIASTVEALHGNPGNVEDVISESVLNEQPSLERFRSAISVFAAVAPLLGLLGTVTGMISTFDVITQYGTGDPKLLSGGISEALITTELGLMVAIPTLLIGNLLASWADKITSGIEVSALRLVNSASGFQKTGTVEA